METRQADLRSIIRLVAILNLAYFGIEWLSLSDRCRSSLTASTFLKTHR
jgi:hypothetical protein